MATLVLYPTDREKAKLARIADRQKVSMNKIGLELLRAYLLRYDEQRDDQKKENK